MKKWTDNNPHSCGQPLRPTDTFSRSSDGTQPDREEKIRNFLSFTPQHCGEGGASRDTGLSLSDYEVTEEGVANIQHIQQLQTKILTRYAKQWRHFPRRETRDPYAIHICEVMSQQTQLSRVLSYRTVWMQDIPDYESLANISKVELLQHRSGLGFNSRALRLQECATVIVEKYTGQPPHSREELLKLPWVWPYTASAICAFTWNMEEAVIDTNIRRVLIFLLKLDETISMKELEEIAKKLIPPWRSRDWHNALMDYGATYLTARKTKIKSVSKQSKFEGSDREVRGWIIKQLVHKGISNLTIEKITSEFPHKDIGKIVAGLVEEGIVKVEKGVIEILE